MEAFIIRGVVYRTKTKTVPVHGGPFRDVIAARIYADAIIATAAALNLKSEVLVYARGNGPLRPVHYVWTSVQS